MKLLLLGIWVFIVCRLAYLVSQLTTSQDLSVYLPGKNGGVKGKLLAEQCCITLQSLTIPLALALLRIQQVSTWLDALWP